MKSTVLTVLFVLAGVFEADALLESWLYGGFEYSWAIEQSASAGEILEATMESPGVNVSALTFWHGQDLGLYVHDSFLFPQSGSITLSGRTYSADLSVYDFLMSIGIIVGPGFRCQLANEAVLFGGLGFHAMQVTGSYSEYVYGYGTFEYSVLGYNLGVGGDIGLKIDLGDIPFLAVGTALMWDPWNYTNVQTSYSDSANWAEDYSYFAVNPFIAIGMSWYRGSTKLGRPES